MELRHSPRINVTWRGLIKIGEGNIVPIRVLNVSSTGVLIQSAQALPNEKEYQVMLEIPHIDQASIVPHKVPCRILVLHSVLSGDYFKVGVKFTEISTLHRDLVAAWVSLASKFDPS